MAYGLTKSATLATASSQYFSVADNAALRVVNGWTFEAWIKPATIQYQSITRIRSGENGWGVFLNSDGTVRAEAGSGAFDGANSTGTITVDEWVHIKVYFNGASTKIYLNGSLDSTVSIPNITNPNTTVYIGSSGAANYFDGQISLVRIWNNDHGSTDDKCTVYGAAESNMNAEWSLDDVLTDASGNGNTLTNNNSITFATDTPATCAVVAATDNALAMCNF